MTFEIVKQYFERYGLSHHVIKLEQSSATVEQAPIALGCPPAFIAKAMSFFLNGKAMLIVAAGDVKIK